DLDGHDLGGGHRAQRVSPGDEQDQQRQGGARIGQEQGVDGGRDVVATDPQGAPDQGGEADGRVGVVQLVHSRALGHGHVLQHPEAADDDPGQQQPPQRQPANREAGELGVLAGQPGQGGRGDKRDGEHGGQAEGEGGPDHGRSRLGPHPMRQVQRNQHDGHGPGDRDQDRAVAVQGGRDHEADDDHKREAQTDQGAHALPAAEGDHGQGEKGGQGEQGPAPFQVLDVVGGGLAGLLGHGQADPLAGSGTSARGGGGGGGG